MAASANPHHNNNNNQQENQQQSYFNGNNNNNINNNNASTSNGHNNHESNSGMKHNPGISADWSVEEQSILDDGLSKYASDLNVVRYAKIALLLPNKTVRDVALRCRWLSEWSQPSATAYTSPCSPKDNKIKKEVSKRRKEDHSRKSKDKREKVTENSSKPSHMAARPSGHPYPMPPAPSDNDDGISYEAIGGPTGELLKQNQQFLQQISINFTSYQVQENISLFCQARDNLVQIMNSMSDTPEIMKQMPPLPVKLNEELASSILPRMNHQMQS